MASKRENIGARYRLSQRRFGYGGGFYGYGVLPGGIEGRDDLTGTVLGEQFSGGDFGGDGGGGDGGGE